MSEKQLIQTVCKGGLLSVKEHEKGAKRRGGIKGFELAATADNIVELSKLYAESLQQDAELRIKLADEETAVDDYWEQRYVTLQLEYVLNILRVAHRKPGDTLSARAVMRYAEIVGVKS